MSVVAIRPNFKFLIRLQLHEPKKIDEGGKAITIIHYYLRPQGCANNDEIVLEL